MLPMTGRILPGIQSPERLVERGQQTEHVLIQRPLSRIFAFTGRNIDDVVNCPIAKAEVLGFYKLSRQVWRTCEIVDLERQWSGR